MQILATPTASCLSGKLNQLGKVKEQNGKKNTQIKDKKEEVEAYHVNLGWYGIPQKPGQPKLCLPLETTVKRNSLRRPESGDVNYSGQPPA